MNIDCCKLKCHTHVNFIGILQFLPLLGITTTTKYNKSINELDFSSPSHIIIRLIFSITAKIASREDERTKKREQKKIEHKSYFLTISSFYNFLRLYWEKKKKEKKTFASSRIFDVFLTNGNVLMSFVCLFGG